MWLDVPEEPEAILKEFDERFVKTELFFDRFAKDKFAKYIFRVHEEQSLEINRDIAHQRVEEAQLFIEASHACEARQVGAAIAQGAEGEPGSAGPVSA